MRGAASPLSRGLERFFAAQPMEGLVVARIVLGSTLFVSYLQMAFRVQEIYGPEGLGGRAFRVRFPGAHGQRPLEEPLDFLHLVSSPELIWVLYGAVLILALAFTLGAFTRMSGLGLLVLHSLFHAHNHWGWGVMIKPYLFYVAMAPVGRYLSIDAWRLKLPATPPGEWFGPAWPVRLLQIHICTMYAVAGIARLDDPSWLQGTMVFHTLNDRTFGRLDVDWFALKPLLVVATYGVFLLEPLAPLMLWIAWIRRWWALALLGMHLGLELLSSVTWWQPMMMGVLCVFLPQSWLALPLGGVRSLGNRIANRVRPRRPPTQSA